MCDAPPRDADTAAPGLAGAALHWYDRHRRDLPWRAPPGRAPDPYAVWVSEIMLQQTTVAAVRPYFAAFMTRWPNVAALARAEPEEVLRRWAGLGYYARARNLHACAKIVAERHGGRFPREEAALRALPGLGPYTAAVVAAIAFGRKATVVDGNVERVTARLYAIATPLPGAKAEIRARAAKLTPDDRPGDYAQAMMDIGATICTPRRPTCAICPLSGACAARALSAPESFPVRARKAARPLRRGAAFFVRRPDGALLVRTRPPKGLLGGMTEAPGTPWTEDYDEGSALRHAPFDAAYRRLPDPVEHVFTHFALCLSVYVADVETGREAPDGCRWAPRGLEDEALPGLMRKALRAAGEAWREGS